MGQALKRLQTNRGPRARPKLFMRRRKVIHGGQNHDRWIVSYADFVTLLFAFFVVLFATANANQDKARAVSDAIKAALDQSPRATVAQAIRAQEQNTRPKPPAFADELLPTLTLLQSELKDEIRKGEVDLRMESRGLTVSFKQAALFDSGEAILKDSSVIAMQKVAGAILHIPNQIRLEGHTDNIPIHNQHFNSNWELSSSRSIAVLQMLTQKFNVPVHRLEVSGYGDVAPIASNDSEEGRTKNRRVDVVILSSLASKSEPGKGNL